MKKEKVSCGVCVKGVTETLIHHLVSWSKDRWGRESSIMSCVCTVVVNLEQRDGAHCSDRKKKVGEFCGKGDSDVENP